MVRRILKIIKMLILSQPNLTNMEAKFKSLSVFDFARRYPTDEVCLQTLADWKWKAGYKCAKCGHKHYCGGGDRLRRQCTACRYIESPTAGTVFHHIKFSLVKAFWIMYYLSTTKKGMATTELSRKLQLRQKTCWLFKRKVMEAMKSSAQTPLTGTVEVDEFIIGNARKKNPESLTSGKKLVVLAIEKRGRGVSRVYARHVPDASHTSLHGFLKSVVDPEAKLRTDAWIGYKPSAAYFSKMEQVPLRDNKVNFPLVNRTINSLISWLRGIHSHAELVQGYLDEYCYRFNRRNMKEEIFDNLLKKMMEGEPCPYLKIIA